MLKPPMFFNVFLGSGLSPVDPSDAGHGPLFLIWST
ncbi:hypothetical protein AGR6A_pb0084 [Agrobacterium sp. NCPPB 925]|nr:hypothetical protein AGR6A_pb0084 [Agrobacterium sp. NCPPB 925]